MMPELSREALDGAIDAEERERREESATRRLLKRAQDENARLEKHLDLLSGIDAISVQQPDWAQPPTARRQRRGVANLMLSDLHLDEVVNPAQVRGRNAYDREIALLRLRRLGANTIKIARDYITGVKYDGLYVWCNGDLLSGNIHDELKQTNSSQDVIDSLDFWVDPLAGLLDQLADFFGKVHVVTSYGNHGRSQNKPPAKAAVRSSFDWLTVRTIWRHMRHDKRFTWNIPESMEVRERQYNCVAVGTRVLTRDLRWVPVESLQVGDDLWAFDADLNGGAGRERTRRWRRSTVLHNHVEEREVVRVTLENGEQLVCTPDHPFLAATTHGYGSRWVEAGKLRSSWKLRRYLKPWDEDRSYEAGWLAGVFDGEGCVSAPRNSLNLSVHQNPGLVADRLEVLLGASGPSGVDRKCRRFQICGSLSDRLSLLGTIRPVRLLRNAQRILEEHPPSLEATEYVRVVSVEPIGRQPVAVMGTSTETYFTEGFGSHNTRFLMTHGDDFKGGDQIAGAVRPVMMGDYRQLVIEITDGEPYDVLLCGHFHMYTALPRAIINGSLIGYGEFAARRKFRPEVPKQAFWVTTPEHGPSFHLPILPAHREQEGW